MRYEEDDPSIEPPGLPRRCVYGGGKPRRSPVQGVTAAVLAGGLGTRLRPVLHDTPKVLARVGDRPFITFLLDRLAAAGIARTVMLTGYQADLVRQTLGGRHKEMTLAYSIEASPLGTAGALRRALAQLESETILLLNGDSYCDVDFSSLVAEHRLRRAEATLVAVHVPDTSRFGQVKLSADRKLIGFEEKREAAGPGWINAGIYVLERALINAIPLAKQCSLERDVLPRWVKTRRCYGVRSGGGFLDIGTPCSYAGAAAFFGQ